MPDGYGWRRTPGRQTLAVTRPPRPGGLQPGGEEPQMAATDTTRFSEIYRRSLEEPEEFWAEAAAEIDWVKPWTRVLDDSGAPFYRWFAGGQLNTCYNALDRHVENGRADQLALIYDSPGDRNGADVHVPRAARRGGQVRRRARRRRRREGRSGDHLHADDPGGCDRDARVRADRRDPLGGLRRLRRQRARDPDRGRPAEGRGLGLVRDRARASDRRTSRCSTPRSTSSRSSPSAASSCSAPSSRPS